jgi:hypothetical protein
MQLFLMISKTLKKTQNVFYSSVHTSTHPLDQFRPVRGMIYLFYSFLNFMMSGIIAAVRQSSENNMGSDFLTEEFNADCDCMKRIRHHTHLNFAQCCG